MPPAKKVVKKVVKKKVVKKKVQSKINRKKLDKKFQLSYEDKIYFIQMRTVSIIKKYKQAILIIGTPGVGKTKSVLEQIAAFKEDPEFKGTTLHLVTGKIATAREFYKTLHDNNSSDTIIVFDDVDDLLNKQSGAAQLIKAACTEKAIRHIGFKDNEIKKDNKDYKTEINFKSRIIFISNIPESKLEHALYSRLNPYEIDVTPMELFDYIKNNLSTCGSKRVPVKFKQEIIDFLEETDLIADSKHFDFRIWDDLVLMRRSSTMGYKEKPKNGEVIDWQQFVYALMQKGKRKKM